MDKRFKNTDWKKSPGDRDHFSRLQVKVFPELCTIGRNEAKIELTGNHLSRKIIILGIELRNFLSFSF